MAAVSVFLFFVPSQMLKRTRQHSREVIIEALTAGLQKVSAQLEASKPAPQVVKNP